MNLYPKQNFRKHAHCILNRGLVCITGLLLSACGGSSSDGDGQKSGAGSNGAPTSIPASQPAGPQVLADVQNTQAIVGDNVIFSIQVAGSGSTYQWFRNGNALPGQTQSTLPVTNVSLSDSSSKFHVRITQAGSSVNSSTGVLSVRTSVVPPRIVKQPIERVVTEGESTQFSVSTEGTGLTFQWHRNAIPIAGATQNVLVVGPTTASQDGDLYRVDVSNAVGSQTSQNARLRVNAAVTPTAQTVHPRLWIRAQDLPSLQTWATPSNPLFGTGTGAGLWSLANTALTRVNNGMVPAQDNGGSTYTPYATESYAALLAFMGLIDSDATRRTQWKAAAKHALFAVIDQADLGVGTGKFRSSSFASSDRGRWSGEAFPLAVDWLYADLTAAEKAKIRRVFLRWCAENVAGYPDVLYYHTNAASVPTGTARRNHASLLDLSDPKRQAVRYSMNNYLMAHARNIFMMANVIDPADDVADPSVPGDTNGRLRDYMHEVFGTYLYMTDYAYRNDGFGGLSPEGAEYGESIGFYYGLMLAIHTSGMDDTTLYGSKVSLHNHPLFSRLMPGFFHDLTTHKVATAYGSVYQPSWFGDGEQIYFQAPTRVMAPHILASRYLENNAEIAQAQWLMAWAPPNHNGTNGPLASAANHDDDIVESIQYFLSFPPGFSVSSDPRSSLPTWLYTPSLGRLQGRTAWAPANDVRLFNYKLSYNSIDHQHGDGNTFDFWRNGEWLTKEFTAYGRDAGLSEFKNTLVIQNVDGVNVGSYHTPAYQRGSQYILGNHDGDPKVLAYGAGTDFMTVTGDSTNLYNFNNGSTTARDVQHASRSLLWLKPDVFVVLDRVRSASVNRFKRFHLQLPNNGTAPQVAGDAVTALTPGGQKLHVRTLLPNGSNATVAVDPLNTTNGNLPHASPQFWKATLDPMAANNQGYRLRVENNTHPQNMQFLHVLQGLDGNANPAPSQLVQSSGGAALTGALVGSALVMFFDDLEADWSSTDISLPSGTQRLLLVGAMPSQTYSTQRTGNTLTIQKDNAGSVVAGSHGVVDVGGL